MLTSLTAATTIASNLYYTYEAGCGITRFSPRVHTAFKIVGLFSCADVFSAIGRFKHDLAKAYAKTNTIAKVKAIAYAITEASGICMDVLCVFDELKRFSVRTSQALPWTYKAYAILFPLQTLWLPFSVYKTCRNIYRAEPFTTTMALDAATIVVNVAYYGAYYGSYLVRPTFLLPWFLLACCITSLSLSILTCINYKRI